MGSTGNIFGGWCACGRHIDPYGVDNHDLGHWCGHCETMWNKANAAGRLDILKPMRTSTMPIPLQMIYIIRGLPVTAEIIIECLGGSTLWFKYKLKRMLLRIVIEGRAYGFESFLSRCTRQNFIVSTTNVDILDVILDGVCTYQSGP